MGVFLTDLSANPLLSEQPGFIGQDLVDNTSLAPVVNPASFSVTNGLNVFIGIVTATNSPTSFAIVSGNPSGFFVIDNAGNLSTTSTPAPNGSYSLGVTATNANGTSPSVTISVTLNAVPVPVVNSASFSITNGLNVFVGNVTATNSPTSFTIASGNPSGFFTINSSGTLSTTSTPAPNGSYSLGITATNASGTGSPTTIPVTLNAPVVPTRGEFRGHSRIR